MRSVPFCQAPMDRELFRRYLRFLAADRKPASPRSSRKSREIYPASGGVLTTRPAWAASQKAGIPAAETARRKEGINLGQAFPLMRHPPQGELDQLIRDQPGGLFFQGTELLG